MMHAQTRNILVYGAGVLGTLYAVRLAQAGHRVALLARGRRLEELQTHGAIIEHALTSKRETADLSFVDSLPPEAGYDLVLVTMQYQQVNAILPALAANHSVRDCVFMVNTPAGYDPWKASVGEDRFIPAFAGAGGIRDGNVVRYAIAPRLLQPTTFGDLELRMTPRLRDVMTVFHNAGFPVAFCADMEAWQKSHVAWVTPLANAIRAAGGDGRKLADKPDIVRLAVDAIREGFRGLRQLGVPILPPRIRLLQRLPREFLTRSLLLWAPTRHFDTLAAAHTRAAPCEIEALTRDFIAILASHDCPHAAAAQLANQAAQCYPAQNKNGERP